MTLRLKSLVFVPVFTVAALFAQEEEDVSPLVESESKPEVEVVSAEPSSVGTKSFDAETVNELFATYKEKNERAAEEFAPHLNFDNMEVIELKAVHSQAYSVRNFDLLAERLDPQPRRRLARLAELDPVAAADIQVTARSEERFFAGEHDPNRDSNAGSTANVDFRKVGESLNEALSKAKTAMRKKKATDDQAPLSTGE